MVGIDSNTFLYDARHAPQIFCNALRQPPLRSGTSTTSDTPDGEVTRSSKAVEVSTSFTSSMSKSIDPRGKVQRVYSTDKVLHSTIGGTKMQKARSAEEKLQQKINDFRQTVFRASVVEDGQLPGSELNRNSLQGPESPPHNVIFRNSTASTGSPSDPESPANIVHNIAPAENCAEQQNCNNQFQPHTRRIGESGKKKIQGSNTSCVSDLIGGNNDDEEDQESLIFRFGVIPHEYSNDRIGIKSDYDSVLSADDFGSIAGSIPETAENLPTRIAI